MSHPLRRTAAGQAIWFLTTSQLSERLAKMASVAMVAEDETTDPVRSLYEEIRRTLNIDFVPNMYKVMATNPAYLAATWDKIKTVMHRPGQLDTLTDRKSVV